MKDQAKIIAALLVGAAAGAALGLLLAPEKGEDIRGSIADYVNDLVEAAKTKAQTATNDIKEYGSNVYDKAKSKFNSVTGEAIDYSDTAVDTAKSKAQDIADGAKTKVKTTANEWNNSVQNS